MGCCTYAFDTRVARRNVNSMRRESVRKSWSFEPSCDNLQRLDFALKMRMRSSAKYSFSLNNSVSMPFAVAFESGLFFLLIFLRQAADKNSARCRHFLSILCASATSLASVSALITRPAGAHTYTCSYASRFPGSFTMHMTKAKDRHQFSPFWINAK